MSDLFTNPEVLQLFLSLSNFVLTEVLERMQLPSNDIFTRSEGLQLFISLQDIVLTGVFDANAASI